MIGHNRHQRRRRRRNSIPRERRIAEVLDDGGGETRLFQRLGVGQGPRKNLVHGKDAPGTTRKRRQVNHADQCG